MKKIYTALAVALAPVFATAQTTFAASNNPRAALQVARLDMQATVLTVRQDPRSVAYGPISTRTVLRDLGTGIAYPLLAARPGPVEGEVELTFAPFLDGTAPFELLDVTAQHAHLYFTDVVYR